MNILSLIKRFAFGLAVGLFVAIVIWSYSAYYMVLIPIGRGVVGSLLLAIPFGIITCLIDVDKLLDSFPSLPFL